MAQKAFCLLAVGVQAQLLNQRALELGTRFPKLTKRCHHDAKMACTPEPNHTLTLSVCVGACVCPGVFFLLCCCCVLLSVSLSLSLSLSVFCRWLFRGPLSRISTPLRPERILQNARWTLRSMVSSECWAGRLVKSVRGLNNYQQLVWFLMQL